MNNTETPIGRITVEAEFRTSFASLHVLECEVMAPTEAIIAPEDACFLDFCLSDHQSSTDLRYNGIWPEDHFRPAGKLFIRPPGHSVQVKSGRGFQRVISCGLDADRLMKFFETEISWTDPVWLAAADVRSTEIKSLLYRLAAELTQPGLSSEILCEALLIQITVELQRHFQAVSNQCSGSQGDKGRVRLVEERVRQHGRMPSLAELAELCDLSIRQLSRIFLEETGKSLGRFVAEQKIEQAMRRLHDGESVKSVAFGLGFSSPASFCYAFRQAVALSPGEFAKRARH